MSTVIGIKIKLHKAIKKRMDERTKLTQAKLAKLTGFSQPYISLIYNGKISSISIEQLLIVAYALNLKVELKSITR